MNEEEIGKLADIITANIIGTQKEVLTSDEAARYMGVSKSYLYKLTMRQQIPHYKPMGKMVYFNRLELENWLQNNRVSTEGEISQQAQAYCMNGSIPDKSKSSTLPKKGDIIRITKVGLNAKIHHTKLKEGDVCEVVSSWKYPHPYAGDTMYVRIKYPNGERRNAPIHSPVYEWEIVKRKWS